MKYKIPKTIFAAFLAVALIFGLSSCKWDNEPSKQRQEIQASSSKAFDQQRAAVPYPADQLTDSLERRNLKERLLRQNDPDKIGYVYFVPFGKFMGYWTIKGKVSSTQSQMNPSDELTDDLSDCSGCFESQVLQSAGDDGSFGEAERGVFFFTTDGAMIQLPEDDYVYADQPISIGNIPELNAGTQP